jgi:uncharacterized membrane protein (Fun14 family)
MAISDFSDAALKGLARHLTAFCKRWDIHPMFWLDGLTLWVTWAGLTWFAFMVSLVFIEIGEKSELSWLDSLIGGGLVGLVQGWILRPHIRQAYLWLGASLLSWSALWMLHIGVIGWMAPATPNLLVRAFFGLLYGGYGGAFVGIGQWWVLRRQVAQAWQWIPLNICIWALAIAFGWVIGGGLRAISNLFVSEVLGLSVAWGAIATLSGLGIVGLLNRYPDRCITPIDKS